MVLWTVCATVTEGHGIKQDIRLRTIRIPFSLQEAAGGLRQLLHEVRGVDEMLHGDWTNQGEAIPEDYRARYDSFMLLLWAATKRGETVRVFSQERGIWVRCGAVVAEDRGVADGRKELFCVRENGVNGKRLELGTVSRVEEVGVVGARNDSEDGVASVTRQFDYDEKEQSCVEETEEKEFEYPTSERFVVDSAHGLGLRFHERS